MDEATAPPPVAEAVTDSPTPEQEPTEEQKAVMMAAFYALAQSYDAWLTLCGIARLDPRLVMHAVVESRQAQEAESKVVATEPS